ncbi:MAG: fumarylacetoacetate hydrolase family protein [Lachnospirales bacterium]
MKLVTFIHLGKTLVGALTNKYIYPLPFKSMNELINSGSSTEKLEAMAGNPIAIQETQLIAPIPVPKQDIICLGINYMAHAIESARYKKEDFGGERPYAVYFSKRVNECTPHNGNIPRYSEIVDSLDYECELAVIIGKDCKNVPKEKAFDYVFGYTILNDISARNLQTRHKQWYFGKSLDGFTPLGPCIATEDEFERPPVLEIKSYINGELRQNSTTDLLIFDIPYVIAELSQGMTLKAGTIISMGTPAGVGMGFKPPKFLKHGDVIECYIENIGTLRNYVE